MGAKGRRKRGGEEKEEGGRGEGEGGRGATPLARVLSYGFGITSGRGGHDVPGSLLLFSFPFFFTTAFPILFLI